jgi:polysaccharide export outer membrane protein
VLGSAASAQPEPDRSNPSADASVGLASAQYALGAGDKLRITVFGEESLSGEYLVPGEGTVAFPLIGDVQATGLTVDQLAREIEARLRDGYLKDPRVSIEVENYRPFYILGEVMKPGEYPFTNGLTVLNAVATANGFHDATSITTGGRKQQSRRPADQVWAKASRRSARGT